MMSAASSDAATLPISLLGYPTLTAYVSKVCSTAGVGYNELGILDALNICENFSVG